MAGPSMKSCGGSSDEKSQTFFARVRLKELKGTHKPLIHPPLGPCREAGVLFCTTVVTRVRPRPRSVALSGRGLSTALESGHRDRTTPEQPYACGTLLL